MNRPVGVLECMTNGSASCPGAELLPIPNRGVGAVT